MKKTLILGIVLALIGVGILAYRQFSYQSRETVLEIGPLKATADRTNTVPLPPILGWALLGSGAVLLIYSARTKA